RAIRQGSCGSCNARGENRRRESADGEARSGEGGSDSEEGCRREAAHSREAGAPPLRLHRVKYALLLVLGAIVMGAAGVAPARAGVPRVQQLTVLLRAHTALSAIGDH